MTTEDPDTTPGLKIFNRPVELPPRGFGSADYARSLAEFGTPAQLPRSGAWYLKRPIASSGDCDGLGCYPFFVCQDWAGLADDLAEVGPQLVSFSAAPDPFGEYDLATLQTCFPDGCIRFKDHYVADLAEPPETIISKHHRRCAEKTLKQVQVEFCTEPLRYLEPWLALFENSVQRFQLTGLRAFSRAAFARQLSTPGIIMSLARLRGEIVAIGLSCLEREVAYAHLVATNEAGRKAGASYALYYSEIHYFSDKARWINWGGEPGVSTTTGGLSSFKGGWSTGTRPAYFCGRIFDHQRYGEITRQKGIALTNYFPAYRQGEFG